MSYTWVFSCWANGKLVAQSEDIDIIPEEYRNSEELEDHMHEALLNFDRDIDIEPFCIKINGTTIYIYYELKKIENNEAGGC